MKTLIKESEILIGDDKLKYYPYYFEIWDGDLDHRLCLKNVLSQWALALRKLGTDYQMLHLPYFLDDQWCLCLRATVQNGKIVLKCVKAKVGGWALNLSDLTEDLTADYEFYEEKQSIFEIYEPSELTESLSQAEIVDE